MEPFYERCSKHQKQTSIHRWILVVSRSNRLFVCFMDAMQLCCPQLDSPFSFKRYRTEPYLL
ncbi:hypothetical protein LINGRAHAP2_LOCUS23817 [Linum grandiflorum]